MSIEGSVDKEGIVSRMEELRSLLTRRVEEPYNILEISEFVKFFARKENELTLAKQYGFQSTKLRILLEIFRKFADFRLIYGDGSSQLLFDDYCSVVEALILEPYTPIFTVNDLWKLVETIYKIRIDLPSPAIEIEEVITWNGNSFSILTFVDKVFKAMNFFGEFLYYCSCICHHENSPLETKEYFTDEEKDLMDEVKKVIKPELGIAILNSCINWMTDSCQYNKFRAGYAEFLYKDVYWWCLDDVLLGKNKLLIKYFSKFIKFLSSESSSAQRYFDLNLLKSDDSCNKNIEYYSELCPSEKLVILLNYFVGALLFVYNEVEDTMSFKDLPAFFKHRWENIRDVETVQHHLLMAKYLLDFVFVDQFEYNFSQEFHTICSAINNIASRKSMFRDATLFHQLPFFHVSSHRWKGEF